MLTADVSRGSGGYATPEADTAPVRILMPQLRFELDRDYVELHQLLKLSGLCDSGGAGKHLVASGAVRVDGAVESRKTCKIRAGQRVTLDGPGERTTIDVVGI